MLVNLFDVVLQYIEITIDLRRSQNRLEALHYGIMARYFGKVWFLELVAEIN